MDWLNDITTAVKSAPSISSTPPKQENKPTPQTDPKPTSVKTDNTPQTETKTPEPKPSKPQDVETEPKTTSSSVAKPKGSASDWLGLNDADDEDDEPASWMRAKSQQKVTFSIIMFRGKIKNKSVLMLFYQSLQWSWFLLTGTCHAENVGILEKEILHWSTYLKFCDFVDHTSK